MMRTWKLAIVSAAAAGLISLTSRPARADFMTNHGVGISAGGGVTGFAQEEAGLDHVTNGGAWDARLSIGTNTIFSIEGQYLGSSQNFQLGSGQLIGNQAAGDLRLNLGTYYVQPFIVGGAGYQWYSLNNRNGAPLKTGVTPTASSEVVVPVGAGVSTYVGRRKHFDLDIRGLYNIGTNNNTLGNGERLDRWAGMANLGYVF